MSMTLIKALTYSSELRRLDREEKRAHRVMTGKTWKTDIKCLLGKHDTIYSYEDACMRCLRCEKKLYTNDNTKENR